MKKKITGFIALLIAVSLLSFGAAAEETAAFKAGDANEDGTVTTADALLTLQAVAGKTVEANTVLADVNANGTVEASDALLILQYAVGKLHLFQTDFDPAFPQCLDEWVSKDITAKFSEFAETEFKDDERFEGKTFSVIGTVDFFGFYNGGAVVTARMSALDDAAVTGVEIDGFTINYTHGIPLYYYKDGTFTDLEKAYENKALTTEELSSISALSAARETIEPSEERVEAIKTLYASMIEAEKGTAPADEITISDYAVIKEGVEICIPKSGAYSSAVDYESVADRYVFEYPALGLRYYVVSDGQLYRLADALEKGILSEDELAGFCFAVNHGVADYSAQSF